MLSILKIAMKEETADFSRSLLFNKIILKGGKKIKKLFLFSLSTPCSMCKKVIIKASA
jgi:hypothetical protein